MAYVEDAPEIYYMENCPSAPDYWLIRMYPFTQEMLQKVKSIPGRRWKPEVKSWLIPKTQETLEQAKQVLGKGLKVRTIIPAQLPERYIKHEAVKKRKRNKAPPQEA